MTNPDIRKILKETKTIAVVGLSSKEERASNAVCKFLQSKGYRVIPVNPNEKEVLGEKSYPDLKSILDPVDMVLVFRRPQVVPEIAQAAVDIGAKFFWMQDGAGNEDAAKMVSEAGLQVVMDDCAMRQYMHLDSQEPIGE
ncbi:MAG: CoA-binding protein [Patescibacteria group bacterium]|nr:CoA-binding protein [Patescibacteria group bacterium]